MTDTPKSELATRIFNALVAVEDHTILDILVRIEDDSLEALYELLDLQARQTGHPVVVVPCEPNIQH